MFSLLHTHKDKRQVGRTMGPISLSHNALGLFQAMESHCCLLFITGAKECASSPVSFLSGHQPDNCWIPGWPKAFVSPSQGVQPLHPRPLISLKRRLNIIDFLPYASSSRKRKRSNPPVACEHGQV